MARAHGQTQVINRFRVGYLMSFNAAGRLRQIIELLDAAGDDWRTRPVDTENFMSRAYYGLMLIWRSEEHTSELQSLMRISYAVFCLKKKNPKHNETRHHILSHTLHQ